MNLICIANETKYSTVSNIQNEEYVTKKKVDSLHLYMICRWLSSMKRNSPCSFFGFSFLQTSFYDNQSHKVVLYSVTRILVKKYVYIHISYRPCPNITKKSFFYHLLIENCCIFLWNVETRKSKICKWFYDYMVLLYVRSVTCGDQKQHQRKFPLKMCKTIRK